MTAFHFTALSSVAVSLSVSLSLLGCSSDSGGASSASASSKKSGAPPAASPSPTPSPTPSATPSASPSSAPATGACKVEGTWTGTYPPGPFPFSGTPVDVTFGANGTGKTESQRIAIAGAVEFAWKLDGQHLSFKNESETHNRFSCPKDQEGKYTLTFTPDCSSFTAKIEADPCQGRAKTMDGISLKKK
jgi:hypothetical protein